MGQLMHDALGIGLAATQVGVMHRVLVYRVETEAAIAALVNPVLEWASDEREPMEEGCLSLPGVLVEVERPVHVRVRAQDERGDDDPRRGLRARGARDPARDGPPRRRPDPRPHVARPAQGGHARRCARPLPRRSAPPPEPAPLRTVYLGTSPFAAAVLERLAAGRAPAGARRHAPRPAARARARAAVAAGRRHRPRARARADPARGAARARRARADRRRRARRARASAPTACWSRSRCSSDYEIFNVHPSLLPRWRGAAPIERAIMAGDAETGVSIMRLAAGLDSGPVCLRGSEPIRPDDDYGTLAARLQELGGELLVRALDERPPWVEQDDAGRHLRAQDRGRRPRARPDAHAGGGRAPRARAAPAHRRAPAAARTAATSACSRPRPPAPTLAPAGRPRAHRRGAAAARLPRRGARADRDPAARRAADAGRAWLRGRPDPALTDFWLDPRLPARPLEELVRLAVGEWDSRRGVGALPRGARLARDARRARGARAARRGRRPARAQRRRLRRRPARRARADACPPSRRRCWRRWASARAHPACSR